jgi:hypothetical protein
MKNKPSSNLKLNSVCWCRGTLGAAYTENGAVFLDMRHFLSRLFLFAPMILER